MPKLLVTWVAWMDERTCPICMALDGTQWQFDTVPEQILHEGKPVWNGITDSSLAHGAAPFHCRCRLQLIIDASDLTEQIQALTDRVRADVDRLAVSP